MLTVLVGTDTAARAKRLAALRAQFEQRGADVRAYTDANWNGEALRELAGASPLFGGEIAVIVSGIGDRADLRDEAEALLSEFGASSHHFVLAEASLLAPFLKKAEKHGTVEKTGDILKQKKAEAFNVFALTDAYADRKRSMAWVLYRTAIGAGAEPRELAGKLFWAVKSMLAAAGARSAAESGLNPFVYQKSKRAAANFAPGELERHARELTLLFHETLASGIDLEPALEAFVLRSLAK